MRFLAGLAVLVLFASAANAATFTGRANVIESDVLEIDGQRIMLYGVDSIEPRQKCEMNREPWECWAAAVRALQTIVDGGDVTCEQVGQPDPYGRVLATCSIAGEDVGGKFIGDGWAVAVEKEKPDYVALEKAAQKAKVGLWAGKFQRPHDWRMANGVFVDRP